MFARPKFLTKYLSTPKRSWNPLLHSGQCKTTTPCGGYCRGRSPLTQGKQKLWRQGKDIGLLYNSRQMEQVSSSSRDTAFLPTINKIIIRQFFFYFLFVFYLNNKRPKLFFPIYQVILLRWKFWLYLWKTTKCIFNLSYYNKNKHSFCKFSALWPLSSLWKTPVYHIVVLREANWMHTMHFYIQK